MKKIISILVFIFVLSTIASAEPLTKIDNSNIKFLKFGLKNKHVLSLQEFLNENGFNNLDEGPGSPGEETGYFGNDTKESIKIFQEFSEIPKTGVLDSETVKKINELIKENIEFDKKSGSENVAIDEEYLGNETVDKTYSGSKDVNDIYNSSNNLLRDLVKKVANQEDKIFVRTTTNEDIPTDSAPRKNFFDSFFGSHSLVNSIYKSFFK